MKYLFKNLFRLAGYLIAILAIVIICLHLWFKHNSEKNIENLITWASKGKLRCSIQKVEINYYKNSIDVRGISIATTDTSKNSTVYKFNVKDFHFRTESKWDLLIHKKLVIDSIVLNNPEILIGERRKVPAGTDKKIVLVDDLERLYRSIHESLDVLNLQLFKINEGKLVVRNDDNPSQKPLIVNHIHFSINKFKIDSATVKDHSGFIHSQRVLLRITDQKILFADNKSHIAFKELLIDSKEKIIRLSGAGIQIQPSKKQPNRIAIQAEKLSVINLDFNALYQKQLIKADSVFLQKPKANFEFYLTGKAKKNKKIDKRDVFDNTIDQLPMAFEIGHIVMQNGSALSNTHQGGKTTRLSAENDNASFTGFQLNKSSKEKFKIRGFNYTIRKYTGFLTDSTLHFDFDSLQFINDKIILHNLTVTTPRIARNQEIGSYSMPRFEITGMDWAAFIFDNKFKAYEAVLQDPVVSFEKNDSAHPQPPSKAKRSIYQNLSFMDQIIDLEKFKVLNGNIHFRQGAAMELNVKGLNLNVDVGMLGKATTPKEFARSLKTLSFGMTAINTPQISVTTGSAALIGNEQQFLLDSIRLGTKNGTLNAIFKNVGLRDLFIEENKIDMAYLSWKEASIRIDKPNQYAGKTEKSFLMPRVLIEKIVGKNTLLHFTGDKISANIQLDSLLLTNILHDKYTPFQTGSLLFAGKNSSVQLSDGLLELGQFQIVDNNRSWIHNILFRRHHDGDSLFANVTSLEFIPSLQQTLLDKKITLDSLIIHQPKVITSAQKAGNVNKSAKPTSLPDLNIRGLTVKDGYFDFKQAGLSSSVKLVSIHVKAVATQGDKSLFVDKLSMKAQSGFLNKKNNYRVYSDGILNIDMDHFIYHPSSGKWYMQLQKFETEQIRFKTHNPEKQMALYVKAFKVRNLKVNDTDLKSSLPWLVNRSGALVQFDSLQFFTGKSDIRLAKSLFDGSQKRINIQGSSILPTESKSDFYNRVPYRSIYMEAKSGEINVTGLQMKDKTLQISQIQIDKGSVDLYTSKLKEIRPVITQPLPVTALAEIGFPVNISEMLVKNTILKYTELNHISKDTGSIHFTGINAKINNITSRPGSDSDSLRANIRASFLDKMNLQLLMSQSYQDSLAGLRLVINLGPGSLTQMNSFLAPLVSLRARSGYLDSLHMTAVGNDYVSKGRMNLYYHKLKAQLLDSGNVNKQKFGTKMIGFFANSIAIRDKNRQKEASFLFVRNRQKSTIVYFLNMVVFGTAGSVAPISNIFLRKKYKKDIQKLPKHLEMVL